MKEFFTVVCDDDLDYAPQDEAQQTFWKRREDDIQRQVQESVGQQVAERHRRKEQFLEKKGLHTTERGRKQPREDAQHDDESGPLRKMARTVWHWIGEWLGWTTAQVTMPTETTTARDATPDEATPRNDAEARAHDKEQDVRERLAHQARATALVMTSTPVHCDEGARRVRRKVRRPIGGQEKRLRERLSVLKDLYERAYFVSCGAKLGADFLAYAGSPQILHAAVAVVVLGAEQRVDAMSIVAIG